MSLRDYSEVLDIGSIWQTRRRGSLNIVLFITNLDLSSEARKKHVPQVVFSDGQHVLSTTVDRFISRREYVRTDKDIANMLFDTLAMPITLEAQSPSFLLDDEADVDDETGIYVGEDEDNYDGPENFSYEDYYPQTPAAISAHEQDEIEKEAEALENNHPEDREDSHQEEASLSISANATEPIHEQEECPVKLYANDESIESIIEYSQSAVDSGIIHEVRFNDKDAVSKIIDFEIKSYLLTLGTTSIEFTAQDVINAYAGYDHGQIFYSVMFLESNEEANEEADEDLDSTEESDNLVIESEKPINITGSVDSIEEKEQSNEEQIEEDDQVADDQTYDLFKDMPDDQATQDEVQTQESDQTSEETQEEDQNNEDLEDSSNEELEDEEPYEEKPVEVSLAATALREGNNISAVVTEPIVSQESESNEIADVESTNEEPELPGNPDSALFVYNKQVEENNALADRLEAAINKEGEENGSNSNSTTTEERSA